MFYASQVALVVKNRAANAGDKRNVGSISGLRRSPGGGHGNPLQYSCLENPVDRGAWHSIVYGVTKSWTRLKRLSMHPRIFMLQGHAIFKLCAFFFSSLLKYRILFRNCIKIEKKKNPCQERPGGKWVPNKMEF